MSKHLKIIQFVRGAQRYGAAVSIRNLCLELDRRGHEVVLMLPKGVASAIKDDKFRTIEIEPHHKFDPRGILAVRNILMKEEPDLLHTHLSAATLTGSLAARLARVPVIATVHGMNKRWTYGFADRLITVSEAGKRYLVDQGIPEARISVAYNGIEIPPLPSAESTREARARLGFGADDLVFGTISRADRMKGVQDAILAMAILRRRVPGARFVFAGAGDYLEQLRKLAQVLGLGSSVRFLGFQQDIYSVLSAIDLFVFPSLREAMGISIVEAMAMGKPVIGTRIDGIPEVLDEESGFLVPAGEPGVLAEACARLAENRSLVEAMGQNGRKRATEMFSTAASAELVERAYSRLLTSYGSQALTAGAK